MAGGGLPTVVRAQAVGIGAQSLRWLWDRPVDRRAPQLPAHPLEAGGSLIFLWVAYLHIFQLSLSILCTKELWGLICLSLLVLYLFISSRVFHEQKFLILMKCHLLMFSFNLKML